MAPDCLQDMSRFPKIADFGSAIFFLGGGGAVVRHEQRAREIVSEQAIYRRERMVNLSIVNYVLSKFTLLALLCTVQCTVLLGHRVRAPSGSATTAAPCSRRCSAS